jgi:serine/threonine protein kinase
MEASVLFTVRSKHLPEVYDAFEDKGRFYLVMQLIEGRNLLEVLKSRVPAGTVGTAEPGRQQHGPCTEQEVLSWLLPIIEVLQQLHSRQPAIIHRDIKPGNILLTPDGTTVLVDFGLTKIEDPKRATQTLIKAVTEGFSPLEQYTGTTGPRSDIYSMAATMYLLLTNRLPPPALQRSYQDDLVAPRLLNPQISPQVEMALLRGLALYADQRFSSMSEFAEALTGSDYHEHDEPTIAVAPPSQHGYSGTQQPLKLPAPPEPDPLPYPYVPYGPQMQQMRPPVQVPKGRGQPAPGPAIKPGYGYVPMRPLPSASNQGCLWGMLQGVLGALLLISQTTATNFYLGIGLGCVFYLLSGLVTTWRGGSSLRGGLAGIWAGVVSTVTFWIIFLVALVVRLFNVLADYGGITSPEEVAAAWAKVYPPFLTLPTQVTGQAHPLLVFLGAGLVVAFLFGWIGGVLGNARYKAKRQQKYLP